MPCYVRGSEKLLEEFKRVLGIEVGETTPDGKFSLDCLRCVGACGLAPVVMIGEKVYGRLQPVDVKKIIEDHGGKIWATSKESIGTVMYFVLRKYQEVPYEQSIDH